MDNFIFALNATLPLFIIIALGFFLQKKNFLNPVFNKTADEFVFKCALPVSLFRSMANMDISDDFDAGFCLFCFVGSTLMFGAVWLASNLLVRDKRQVGAFAQASARSSASLLGIALATNIYGDAGMVPLMIMSSVPFFNAYSVIILSFSPQIDESGRLIPAAHGKKEIKKAFINVLKNPLIIGIAAGLPFSLLRIQIPTFIDSALKSLGGTATPVALLVIGASLCGGEAVKSLKTAAFSSLVKLFILPAVFIPVAGLMGFRDSSMIAILIMSGSPTTVACYIMAKNMKADSVLTSNAVLISTLLSSVSLTLWLYIMKTLGWV